MNDTKNYKDQLIFSINDVVAACSGNVYVAIRILNSEKYANLTKGDLDPLDPNPGELVWRTLANEFNIANSISKGSSSSSTLDDITMSNTIEIDYVDDGGTSYYALLNTDTGELEDYDTWDAVQNRMAEIKGAIGVWMGEGSPPESNIIWEDNFDDKESFV